jgi:hypothetical protein
MPHPVRIAAASTLLLIALMVPAGAETMAPTALNSLTAAPSLGSAQVMDQHRRVIGTAPRVQTDQDGKPAALAFTAQNGTTIVLGAAAVSFDGSVLVADSSQPQIVALNQAPALRTAVN